MPYAILRFAKRKAGGVTANYAHNERKKEIYKSNSDIDTNRTPQNYHLVKPKQSYRREVSRMTSAAGCKVRSNSTVMVETLITASPEFMNDLPEEEQQEFFSRAFDFMAEKIGKDNIISAVVHMDEKTPHMHLSFCPITPDKRLSAKDLLGNQKKLSDWQTQFYECMSARFSELERGLSSMDTGRKHIPLWLFKAATRLDKQFEKVQAALSDINAFNAGKKRDKALGLLSEWLPQAQRFTAQIKKVDSYIQSLESETSYQSQCNNDLQQTLHAVRSDKEDKEWKHYKEIKSLEERLRKQQRLIDRIPPEVIETLKNSKERGKTR